MPLIQRNRLPNHYAIHVELQMIIVCNLQECSLIIRPLRNEVASTRLRKDPSTKRKRRLTRQHLRQRSVTACEVEATVNLALSLQKVTVKRAVVSICCRIVALGLVRVQVLDHEVTTVPHTCRVLLICCCRVSIVHVQGGVTC